MNPDKCFPSPLFLAIIIIILFVNYYSSAATTTTFTPIDNYLIACGSSQNITFAGRTFIFDPQHYTSRVRDFSHLPPNQNTFSSAAAEASSPSLSRSTSAFSPTRSAATRRWRREICPVAMDPPSMVRVFAVDESV
ncbi:receptor-like protein kinase THESEUS 1 [Senna tora]|uniref:Receptor-like protein kinase THESEUS 1 n=1 Tax=Senna tora TaxID=362788 RepID=A0A834WU78_9FABA|nr:receptor-like protein kinase THESEUS 1 [Senna tora]